MARLLGAAVMTLLLVAGCVSNSGSSTTSLSDEQILARLDSELVSYHDHSDPALHPGSSWGIEEVFRTTLPMAGAGAVSPPSEFVLWDHYAFVSLFHPSAGFVILDIADPEHPKHVGFFDAGTAYVNDVEVSPDGRWAFVPTQPMETEENSPVGGGTPFLADHGVQVADLSNLTAPTLATFYNGNLGTYSTPLVPGAVSTGSSGYHRLDVEEINGALYVFGTNNQLARVDILRFDAEPAPLLTFVSSYQSDDGRDAMLNRMDGWASTNVHDVTVGPDPLTGSPLLAVAHWESGVHFLDVSDPAAPELLGIWQGFTDVLPGNVHNVEFTAVEGRRIAVAVPEYPSNYERQGIVWIIDATDFEHPVTIGSWSLPGLHPVEGGTYVFTTDRTEIRNGTIYAAHFHAGVMVLDISTMEKARDPELVGYIIPSGQEAIPYQAFTTNPIIYDAIPQGEYLYMADLLGGFSVAKMEPQVYQRE